MSLRLVPLHGRVNGHEKPMVTMWVNPEAIVTVRPKVTGVAPVIDLHIEVKMQGMPLFESWAGRFGSTDEADAVWSRFLTELTGTGTAEAEPEAQTGYEHSRHPSR